MPFTNLQAVAILFYILFLNCFESLKEPSLKHYLDFSKALKIAAPIHKRINYEG